MGGEPIGEAGQGEAQEFLGLGAVEGAIGRAGRAGVFLERGGFDFGIELRPACGEETADLPARKAFAPCKMIDSGLVAGGEFPNGAGGDGGGNGGTKFIGEEAQGATLLPAAAEFLVEAAVAGGRDAAIE